MIESHTTPNLTKPSGQALTTENWLSIGIETISCDLQSLLVKPGFSVLQKQGHLKNYWAWPGKLILNCTDVNQFKSPINGQTLKFTPDAIESLIEIIQPDEVTHLPNNQGNLPAEDALNGKIYTAQNGCFSIEDSSVTLDFALLDASCKCPACGAGLTRAYFHHLFKHTPLLCHRWLIMHNYYVIRNSFNKY